MFERSLMTLTEQLQLSGGMKASARFMRNGKRVMEAVTIDSSLEELESGWRRMGTQSRIFL